MLNAWRKVTHSPTKADRVKAAAAAVALAVTLIVAGALIAVAVIDDRDVDLNWTVVADVGGRALLGAAALIGAIGGIGTLRQRIEADQRAEWWKRAEKTSDYLVSENLDKIDIGSRLLEALDADDRRTGRREWIYLNSISAAGALDVDDQEGDNGQDEGGSDG